MLDSMDVKQQLLDILEKALKKLGKLHGKNTGGHAGLVQIQRTVTKQGTTFIQKFWVKPDQVKDTDVVVGKTKPKEDSYTVKNHHYGERTIHFSYDGDFVSGDALRNNPNVSDHHKKFVKKIVDQLLQHQIKPMHFSENLNMEHWDFKQVEFPEDLKFDISIVDAKMDGEDDSTLTLQYVTSLKADEVDSDTRDWLLKGIQSSTYGAKKQFKQVVVDGKLAFQTTFNLNWWDESLKKKMYYKTINKLRNQVEAMVDQKMSEGKSLEFLTSREQDKFNSEMKSAIPTQLSDYRTTGLCAGDFKATRYIHNLARNYLLNTYTPEVEKLDLRFNLQQLKDQLNSYVQQVEKNIKEIDLEHHEIKTKISSVPKDEYDKLSAQVIKDWDNKHHGKFRCKIHGIYEVSDMPVEQDFNSIVEKNQQYSNVEAGGKNCQLDTFYHGTGSIATTKILGHSGQFEIVEAKVGRMMGDGVYMAEVSSKSAQYISDKGYSRKAGRGSLMIVEASLGNCNFDPMEYNKYGKLIPLRQLGKGYDSMGAGGFRNLVNQEWCTYDPKAVKPKYIIDMEIQ